MPAIALVLCALALVPAVASGQEEQRIAPGVSAGGVDLSNLLVSEAATLLEDRLAERLAEPVVVRTAGRRFTLTARQARHSFDALRTAKRAYYAGRDNPPPPSGGGGTAPGIVVPLAMRHSKVAVREFAMRVDRAVYRAPRNASVQITVTKLRQRGSQPGLDLDARALAAEIDRVLDDPVLLRALHPERRRVDAPIQLRDLSRVYGTVITINRSTFKLRLFKRLRLARTFDIAVGMAGVDTPRGVYRITSRQVNPTWHVPKRAWAGALAGTTVPGGAPNNPLKARWLGITNGVGIHGTAEEWSIGSRASHGCIRMRVADVIRLYPRVPVGTRVLIR